MRQSKLLILFMFFLQFGIANRTADSLKAVLKTAKSDTAIINTHIRLGKHYINIGDVLRARSELNKALSYEKKHRYPKGEIDAKYVLAKIHLSQGDYSKAIKFYFEGLNIANEAKLDYDIANSLNAIGVIYWYQGDDEKAMEYYEKALKINLRLNDQTQISGLLNNIGMIQRKRGMYTEAFDSYTKAIDIYREINDRSGLANTVNNIGILFFRQLKFKEALSYFEQSYKIRLSMRDKIGIATSLGNIGDCYFSLNQIEKAKEFMEKSLAISIEENDSEGILTMTSTLSEVYEKQGNGMKALEYYKKYLSIEKKLLNEESKKESYKQELNFKFEQERLKENQKKEKQKLKDNEARKKQQIILLSVCGILLIVIVFSFFLYNRFKISQKQRRLIEVQKKIVEEKNKDILDSIHYAKRIQHALINTATQWQNLITDHFILFKPKSVVSGDFYWSSQHTINGNTTLFIAVCDSTGHGVPGAFMSLLNISYLNEAINEKNIFEPGKILDHVRTRLIENLSNDGGKDGMDGIVVRIEKLSNNNSFHLTYAAANNAPILLTDNGISELQKDMMPIGLSSKKLSFTTHSVDLKLNDRLYLITDGFPDQFGGDKGKKLKYKTLYDLFKNTDHLCMSDQCLNLDNYITHWMGNYEQTDDICIIGIQF